MVEGSFAARCLRGTHKPARNYDARTVSLSKNGPGFFELFTRQSRTEISITRLDQFRGLICQARGNWRLPRMPSSAGYTKRSAFTVTGKKLRALPVADTEGAPAARRVVMRRSMTSCYNLDPVDLFQSNTS